MNKDKEIAMNQTYRQFLNAGMGLGATDVLDGSVEDGLMGFGTAIDEKVFGLGQLKEMIAQQTVQSKDMDL